MYCRSCGTLNADRASQCIRCGAILQVMSAEVAPPPPNNLAFAIVVTVLCCLPLGIPAIVYAAQVNSKAQAGDLAGAIESARRSRMWSWWGLGVGLAGFGFYIIVAILAAVFENS